MGAPGHPARLQTRPPHPAAGPHRCPGRLGGETRVHPPEPAEPLISPQFNADSQRRTETRPGGCRGPCAAIRLGPRQSRSLGSGRVRGGRAGGVHAPPAVPAALLARLPSPLGPGLVGPSVALGLLLLCPLFPWTCPAQDSPPGVPSPARRPQLRGPAHRPLLQQRLLCTDSRGNGRACYHRHLSSLF